MEKNDFFKKVDSKLHEILKEKKKVTEIQSDLDEKVKSTIKESQLMLQKYLEELEKRGIKCGYQQGESYLWLTLFYPDGEYVGFFIEKDIKYGGYKFVSHFTSRSEPYTGKRSYPKIGLDFSVEHIKEVLEHTIMEFLSRVLEHGGI